LVLLLELLLLGDVRRVLAAEGLVLEVSRGGTRLCRVRLDAAAFVVEVVVELDDVDDADDEERARDEETMPSIRRIHSAPSLWLK
jgi:hypothetical protein